MRLMPVGEVQPAGRAARLAATRVMASVLATAVACLGVGAVSAGPQVDSLERNALRAQLSPVNQTTLAAGIAERIERLTVREGESFKKGDLLVAFDCSVQRAQMRKAEASLDAAEATHVANQRLADLKAIGDVELAVGAAEVAKAEADIGYLKAVLGKCTIHAPFAGRAGETFARAKQFVDLGEPVLEVFDDRALELEFIVPSRWLAWLKPGYAFSVDIDDTGKRYEASLTRTAARVDPLSRSVKVIAKIKGDHPELLAGMSGRVAIASPADIAQEPLTSSSNAGR